MLEATAWLLHNFILHFFYSLYSYNFDILLSFNFVLCKRTYAPLTKSIIIKDTIKLSQSLHLALNARECFPRDMISLATER